MSIRGENWKIFSAKVLDHIENYTVPQYGDKGEDQVTGWSANDCMTNVKKYCARFGKNSRPGQEELDLFKAAHYTQLTAEKMEEEKYEKSSS